mgnify:CR=1 FL=1
MTESVKPFSKLYDLTQRAEKVGISDDDVLREIRIEKIVPNKYQPRREFTEDKIKELEKRIFKLEMDAYVSNELLTKARFELHKIKMYVAGIICSPPFTFAKLRAGSGGSCL